MKLGILMPSSSRDVVVFMPPLCSTEEELLDMLDIIETSITEVT